MLESRFSYDFKEGVKQTYKTRPVSHEKFRTWTNKNRFRSIYTDSFNKNGKFRGDDCKHVAPGYKGFVPGLKCDNLHGAGYSELARKGFAKSVNLSNLSKTATG